MNKPFALFTIGLVSFCSTVFAQPITSTRLSGEVGPELKMEEIVDNDQSELHTTFTVGTRILAFDGNNTFILGKKSITCIEGNNKVKYIKEVKLKSGGMELTPKFILYSNGNLYAFAMLMNKGSHRNTYFKTLIDKNTGLPKGPLEKLFDLADAAGGGMLYSSALDRELHFGFSPDSSKIMIAGNMVLSLVGNKNHTYDTETGIAVFDKDMKLQWKHTAKNTDRTHSSWAVDNDGGVAAITLKVFTKDMQTLVSYWTKDGEPAETAAPIGAKAMATAFDKNGVLYCAAVYSASDNPKDRDAEAKGVIYFTFNPKTKTVADKIDYTFTTELVTQAKNNYQRETDNTIYSIAINQIVPDNNGGALLIGEQSYIIDHYRYLGSLLVLRTDKQQVKWATAIPKVQVSSGTTGSYALATKGDNTLMLYNDHEDNFSRTDHKYKLYKKLNGSDKILVTIDGNGKYSKELIGKNDASAMRPFLNHVDATGKWVMVCGVDNPDYFKLKVLTMNIK